MKVFKVLQLFYLLLLFIKMGIDLDKNVVFVDVSYLVFYRFFALKKWYGFAHKDQREETSKPNYKWLENTVFMEKYKKTLLDTILAISKKNKVPIQNIVFALDCHFRNNWRLRYCNVKDCPVDDYKGDRKSMLSKQQFTDYKIFDLVENLLLVEFAKQHKNIILKHKNAEADDCIALGIKCLLEKYKFKNKIWIVASDYDYIQICGEQIHLINLKKKRLDKKQLEENNITNQEYLIKKIMIGDKSDNIKPCQFNEEFVKDINQTCNIKLRKNKQGKYNVTENTFNKLRECPEYWNTIIDYFNQNKNNKTNKTSKIIKTNNHFALNQTIFDLNQRLIDFDLIPNTIKIKL